MKLQVSQSLRGRAAGGQGDVPSAGGARSRPRSLVFGGAISNARPLTGGSAGGVTWTGGAGAAPGTGVGDAGAGAVGDPGTAEPEADGGGAEV